MDKMRWEAAKQAALRAERAGIGTLGEKGVHAALKYYFAPDPADHERPVAGFVADIAREDGIVEIQSRQFRHLDDKLAAFLPLGPVTVVYPVIVEKRLLWVDETGEVIRTRKSNKKGRPADLLAELYGIRRHLEAPGLSFHIVLLTAEEVRERHGRTVKRGELLPGDLQGEMRLSAGETGALAPELPRGAFTAKEFAKAAGYRPREGSFALQTLVQLGLIRRAGTRGKAYLYEKSE